jgi:hypothetical protein
MQIIGLPKTEKSVFWSPHAISVPSISPGDIQQALDNKKERFQDYRKHAEEIWLLIPYEITGKPSTVFDSGEILQNCKYKSPFHKVFLMNCFMRSFVEILVK